MKILLIDMTNLSVKNAFASVKADPEENHGWHKWSERTTCDVIELINTFAPDRCVLAMDADTYWRKEVYPEYKANRRRFKDGAIVDFESFDSFYQGYMTDFAFSFTNVPCIKVADSEADDVIAVLTKYHSGLGDSIVVVSADKDFNQLTSYPNVKHYSPMTRREVLTINPKKELEIKVICGDSNDDIPPIKRGIGAKTAEKLLNSGADILNSSDTVLAENYKRNRILIDFDLIPDRISRTIIEEYKKFTSVSVSGKKMFPFIMQYGTGIMDRWQKAKLSIEKLI